MTTDIVKRTASWSLLAQLLFATFAIAGIFVPLSGRDVALREIAVLETVVQAVEFAWYTYAVYYTATIRTYTRYLDWFFSTPVMIFSFLVYYRYKHPSVVGDVTLLNTLTDGTWIVILLLLLNQSMLLFGYLVETCRLRKEVGLPAGTAVFIAQFYLLYYFYVRGGGAEAAALYFFTFAVWALYGVVATMEEVPKNVLYNVLDLFSKNFYGVFLFVVILLAR